MNRASHGASHTLEASPLGLAAAREFSNKFEFRSPCTNLRWEYFDYNQRAERACAKALAGGKI